MIPKEVVGAVLVFNQSLAINHDCKHYTYTLSVKYKYIITGKVKVQKTTIH